MSDFLKELFTIAGGDIEAIPNPDESAVLDCIRSLREDYDAAGAELSAPTKRAIDLRGQLQQKCVDWNTYWRASDAHGVKLSIEQALELLRDALGVEVAIDLDIYTNPVYTWRNTWDTAFGDASIHASGYTRAELDVDYNRMLEIIGKARG